MPTAHGDAELERCFNKHAPGWRARHAEIGEADDGLAARGQLEEAYRRLCGIADQARARNNGKRVTRKADKLVRSASARRAVLLRSRGHCENPHCAGQPEERTDTGDPILEIDHINDLARGGPDVPSQMIALFPNCHAIKTRGRTREDLRRVLFTVARCRHDALSESES